MPTWMARRPAMCEMSDAMYPVPEPTLSTECPSSSSSASSAAA